MQYGRIFNTYINVKPKQQYEKQSTVYCHSIHQSGQLADHLEEGQ